MKKNWKKTVSVLLLAALLCALPGTLAWGENVSTDVGAIVPDGPAGNQTGGEGDGTGSSGAGSQGTGSGAETGGTTTETNTSGTTDNQGSSGSGNTAGKDQGTTGGATTPDTPTDQSGSGSSPVIVNGGTVIVPEDTPTSSPTTPPEATPTPSPTATPSPSPTATPTPTPSLPIITKDPTDETVDVGGDCWFIADYSNAQYAVWHFISPDGKTDYRYNDPAVATAFPGLKIENGDQSNLHLSSIPAQMNGWGSYCEYSNNAGSVRTSAAVVYVKGAPAATPTPSPSATPTAKPSPSPTPSATPTVTPSPSPAATQIPVVSPTPEGTQEPPTALNRGGKIFLLFGAVALVVGAAAIGTILLVSKRMSAKEAYTYKSGSRRRK